MANLDSYQGPDGGPVQAGAGSGVDWDAFAKLLRDKQRILLTSHIRPDCDALGSELGMAAVLRRLGKQVRIVNAFPVPRNLQFMNADGHIEQLEVDVPRSWVDSIDLLIVLDTSARAQLGGMNDIIDATTATKAVVDHHVSNDDLGALLFKDSSAEATGRLVAEAADHLGVPLDREIAEPLLAALATDTGWFRFSSVTAETFTLAARLVEAGASPADLYRLLYENETLGRLNLVGTVLGRAETLLDGKLIYTHIGREDFASTGALTSDSEDVVNELLKVEGTRAALIFVERDSGDIKVSFRSRCELDCAAVASEFGGGGHRKAAGAMLAPPVEAAKEVVLRHVVNAMRELKI